MGSIFDLQASGGVLHEHFDWLITILDWASALIELAAIALLIIGAARFILGVATAEIARTGTERVRTTNRERIELGRYILAGLELFIVADIIRTALSLAFADLLFLGLLVVIRSIISFFLDRELKELRHELDAPNAAR
jgi:uncharacterized membrane protein